MGVPADDARSSIRVHGAGAFANGTGNDGVCAAERACKVQLDPGAAQTRDLAVSWVEGASGPCAAGDSVHEQYCGMTRHPRFLRLWYCVCNVLNTLCCAVIWVRSCCVLCVQVCAHVLPV